MIGMKECEKKKLLMYFTIVPVDLNDEGHELAAVKKIYKGGRGWKFGSPVIMGIFTEFICLSTLTSDSRLESFICRLKDIYMAQLLPSSPTTHCYHVVGFRGYPL
jgi:hypothetical protein